MKAVYLALYFAAATTGSVMLTGCVTRERTVIEQPVVHESTTERTTVVHDHE